MTNFVPRYEEPSRSSSYYYSGNPFYQAGYGIPNCTCYAFGRIWEITGKYPSLSTSDASDWWGHTSDGYKRGQTPKLGAVICWSGGSGGYGHVAIVEEIKANGDIVYSESWYGSKIFGTDTATKSSGYYFSSGYSLQGFIYCGIEFNTTTTANGSTAATNQVTANQILNPSSRNMTAQADPKLTWQFLILKIKNPYGVAGLMGNLYHESALIPINLEGSREDDIGYDDAGYTRAVDNGSYSSSSFINDSAGYGLAQWTYYSRKQNFYNYCKSKGASIGNLITQLEFLYNELASGYPTVLNTLKNAKSVQEASNAVLHDYEAPANQSASVENQRASTGSSYYDKYKSITATSLGTSSSAASAMNPETEVEEVLQFTFDILAIGEIEE